MVPYTTRAISKMMNNNLSSRPSFSAVIYNPFKTFIMNILKIIKMIEEGVIYIRNIHILRRFTQNHWIKEANEFTNRS